MRIVENEIVPGLGRLKADEVKKGDIRALVDKIADRAPTMARRTRGVLRLLYAWAVEHDRVAAMPPFPKPLGQENRRSRVLAESEIQRAWQAMDAESGILGSAFKLMLLTGQRRGEVLQMRWRNVTEETGPTAGWWWMIPAEFAKNGRAHRVPLSPQAIGILDHLRPITGQGEWVFPSPHQGKGPILNPQKAAERLWKRARIEDATLHDLRRTCGTFVSGFFGASGRFVVKLLLNHSDREVTAIYDRHSYDAEKRQALEEWGKRLTGIISGNGGPGLIPALKQGVVGSIPTGPSNQAGDEFAIHGRLADMSSNNREGPELTDRRAFLRGAALAAALVPLAACRKRSTGNGSGRTAEEAEALPVGSLPVTCNLTLPVACEARMAARRAQKTTGSLFEFRKYSGWPEIKESLMSGGLQAAYMLAPLVMDLTSKKIPIKIVSLGHRSGAVIMVRTDSPYRRFKDLAGKRIAIPSRFAVDFLFLRKMLAQEGMTQKDIELMEMAPPDMPAALYAKAVDAYCTGEPFGAAAQQAGYAIPLRMTRDEWPNYICCVLTVREELIQSSRPLVQDLVNYVLAAGTWLDAQQANRDKAVEIAAGRRFFNQDRKILQFVMENPSDRVTYGDLRLIRAEFDELMQLSIEAGTLSAPVPYERYVDESFAKAATATPIML